MTRAKSSGAYVNSMLALQEAISGGADKPYYWTQKAMWLKAQAKTSLSLKTV